jgi:hypothetical protein
MKHFEDKINPKDWYFDQQFYEVEQGRNCCSDYPVQFHNLKNISEIFLIEYLIYNVNVFGLNSNQNEVLPRKFTMKEILEMANLQSNSSYWTRKEVKHQMDDDEF